MINSYVKFLVIVACFISLSALSATAKAGSEKDSSDIHLSNVKSTNLLSNTLQNSFNGLGKQQIVLREAGERTGSPLQHSASLPQTKTASSFDAKRQAILEIHVHSEDDSESFSELICSIGSGYFRQVEISGSSETSSPLEIPSCLGTVFNTLERLQLEGDYVLRSFSHLPVSLKNLHTRGVRFAPSTSGAPVEPTGLSGPNEINWDEFNTILSNLTHLYIEDANLDGPLPQTLLGHTELFHISTGNQMSGTISPTLFARYMDSPDSSGYAILKFSIAPGSIAGSIPSNLFTPFAAWAFSDFEFSVNDHQITGSIPASLTSISVNSKFVFSMASNQLTGSIPEHLLSSNISEVKDFKFDVSNNQLSGSFPSSFFEHLVIAVLDVSFKGNNISGPLPNRLFANGWSPELSGPHLWLDFSANKIQGTVPSGFISASFLSNVALNGFKLDLSANALSGTIPADLLSSPNFTAAPYEFYVSLASNKFVGSLPGDFLDSIYTTPEFAPVLSIDFSNNQLTGSIPDGLLTLANIVKNGFYLKAENNQLTGELPSSCLPDGSISWILSNNSLDGTIPASWGEECGLRYLDISHNSRISGSIPSGMFNWGVLRFHASHTGLNGSIPQQTEGLLLEFDLSYTNVKLCNRDPFTTFPPHCNLQCSDAANCPTQYSSCTTTCNANGPSSSPGIPSSSPGTPSSSPRSGPNAPTGAAENIHPSLLGMTLCLLLALAFLAL